MARTITEWATAQLAEKLDALELCQGVSSSWDAGGTVHGEVTLGERKGKCFPVYTLEVELPIRGESEGAVIEAHFFLPDISLEMIDDLEVDLCSRPGQDAIPPATETALASGGVTAVQTAVREWAAALRKAVADDAASIPLDPPTQMQQPRAAALISSEEAMSAAGAAALDEAQEAEEDEIEDVPRADEDGVDGEEAPFTQEEVDTMLIEVRTAIEESFAEDEGGGAQQLTELEGELEGKDLQEQGRILLEVLEYLNNPDGEEGGGEEPMNDGEEGPPPYEGEEALQELWKDVVEMCNEQDVPNLEDELKGRAPEEQWRMLLEVRDYLMHGDEEEREAFANWQPSLTEIEREWAKLLKRVPEEELSDLQNDWGGASEDDKKRLVWDVRKLLDQQDEMDEAEEAQSRSRGADDDALGKNEVRRRGARRGAEYEYNYEYDFDKDGADWDENYDKESKRARQGGKSLVLVCGGVSLLAVLAVLLTATLYAEDDEPVLNSALRLLRIN